MFRYRPWNRRTPCDHSSPSVGPVARPSEVIVVEALPKTRSGKIMRRLLLGITRGEEPGDTTSLVDPDAFLALARGYPTRQRI